MRYKLLALDVDGTLVGPDNRVPTDTVEALAGAERAGLRVCIATGRSLRETLPVWRQLCLRSPFEPMILVGGAMVSECESGRTLYHRPIATQLAWEFGDAMADMGFCAMAIVDAWRHGVDYYLSTDGDLASAQRAWLNKMDVKLVRVRRLSQAADMPAPLRVSTVVPAAGSAESLAAELRRRFEGRLNVNAILAPNYGVMIVEAHAVGADKFSALTYVAQALRVGPGSIVAVGDDTNDLAMFRGAGLAVAMPSAPTQVRAAAHRVAERGLAAFIRDLIAENGQH